jgi:UDP-glucose 4-epimerase
MVYNLGTDETIVVEDSIATITAHLGITPRLEYAGGVRGWLGDSPLIHLDCERIRALGWRPTLSIPDAIRRTVDWLQQNPGILDEREAA